MRSVSQHVHHGIPREAEQRGNEVAHPDLEHYLGQLTDAGLATLLEWAKRNAPDLLRTLMISFISGKGPDHQQQEEQNPPPSTEPDSREDKALSSDTLRTLQQEHIIRVVSESKTLTEAAARLGIHNTTLWRKLKQYKDRPR